MKVEWIMTECQKKFLEQANIAKEQYDEAVKLRYSSLKNSNLLFYYSSYDAWHRYLKSICVSDVSENNLCFTDRFQNTSTYTITSKEIDCIKSLIKKYASYFLSDNYSIEDANLYDGYIQKIALAEGQTVYYFECDNLQSFDKSGNLNVNILIQLIEGVFSILTAYDTTNYFCKL